MVGGGKPTSGAGGRFVSTREDVLFALSRAEGPVSGEALAREMGISREAVWKAVNALREEGYGVESMPNRGYQLRDRESVLTERGVRAYLGGDAPVEIYRSIDSTNNRAKALAMAGAPHGALVIADMQTMGRGRMGRAFYSPAGSGLYMSVVLRPRVAAERAVKATVIAAVAAARAVEKLSGLRTDIKWVNDLYAGGKKLAGILTEAGMDLESGNLDYCVTGIGVNLRREAYPEELRGIATSVEEQCGERIPRARLAAEITRGMLDMMEDMGNPGIMREYRERSNVIGREVLVTRGDERFEAVAEAIDNDGALVVRTAEGAETLRSGEVSLRVLG